ELDATDSELHVRRGSCLLALGQIDAAVGEFTRAIELRPDNLDAYHQLAIARMSGEQFDEAIAELSRALAGESPHPVLLHVRGRCLAAEGEFARAEEDFSRALEIAPDFAPAWFERARLRASLEQFD